MYISVKTIDTLKSTVHKGRVISEYIIYVMIGDVAIKAYTEYGSKACVDRIDELKKEYNINDAFYEIN